MQDGVTTSRWWEVSSSPGIMPPLIQLTLHDVWSVVFRVSEILTYPRGLCQNYVCMLWWIFHVGDVSKHIYKYEMHGWSEQGDTTEEDPDGFVKCCIH